MSQEKNAPPPAPVPVQEERPKLAEPDLSSEQSKLAEVDTTVSQKGDAPPEGKSEPKEVAPEISTTKKQADSGAGSDGNSNRGSNDVVKP